MIYKNQNCSKKNLRLELILAIKIRLNLKMKQRGEKKNPSYMLQKPCKKSKYKWPGEESKA